MTRISIRAFIFILASFQAPAQSMDDLNIQVHGYATQGFIYTTSNNWNTTDSTDGSAAWTEAVVNLTATPTPKLRIGVQARYFLLGTYGNAISLDWAQADYKVNELIGFRIGKVKTPAGLLNESQDIDPAHTWVLLPQSIYPLASRNSTLAHYGGVVYGSASLGESAGKLEYRAYGGQRVVDDEDGYLKPLNDEGLTLPNGLTGRVYGGTLHWITPLPGLMVGASDDVDNPAGSIVAGPLQGNFSTSGVNASYFFARFEHRKLMIASEYNRITARASIQFTGLPNQPTRTDRRGAYLMTTYKLTEKLTGGLYFSTGIDRQAAFTSSRYQKDWAISARYDINPFFYLKAEQHVMDGNLVGYSSSDNPNGLQPNTRMTLLKLGVSF